MAPEKPPSPSFLLIRTSWQNPNSNPHSLSKDKGDAGVKSQRGEAKHLNQDSFSPDRALGSKALFMESGPGGLMGCYQDEQETSVVLEGLLLIYFFNQATKAGGGVESMGFRLRTEFECRL